MAIRFLCPIGHRLVVPDERAGKKGRCPVCNQKVVIPLVSMIRAEGPAPPAVPATIAPIGMAPPPPRGTIGRENAAAASQTIPAPPPAAEEAPTDQHPADRASADKPPADKPPADMGLAFEQLDLAELDDGGEFRSFGAMLMGGGADDLLPPAVPEAAANTAPRVAAPLEMSSAAAIPPSEPASPLPPPVPATAASAPPRPAPPAPLTPPRAAPIAAAAPITPSAILASAALAEPGAAPIEPAYEAPEPSRVQTVYLLAVALVVATLFCALPALRHLNLSLAPNWARIALLVAVLQLVYVVWIVSIPDWSTVWVGMIVCALVAALYGTGMAVAIMTPQDRTLLLDLTEVRRTAAGWCAAVVLVMGLMTYLCGRVAWRWRRAWEVARRAR